MMSYQTVFFWEFSSFLKEGFSIEYPSRRISLEAVPASLMFESCSKEFHGYHGLEIHALQIHVSIFNSLFSHSMNNCKCLKSKKTFGQAAKNTWLCGSLSPPVAAHSLQGCKIWDLSEKITSWFPSSARAQICLLFCLGRRMQIRQRWENTWENLSSVLLFCRGEEKLLPRFSLICTPSLSLRLCSGSADHKTLKSTRSYFWLLNCVIF